MILNTLPIAKGLFTRFMSKRGRTVGETILDYGLVDSDHVNYVSSFVIDADARYDCGSDHALLTVNVAFKHTPSIDWKFNDVMRFNITEKTNYGPFKHRLDEACKIQPLHIFDEMSLDEKLQFITNCIQRSGRDTLGFKVGKKERPTQLPLSLRNMIREKNEFAKNVRNKVYASAEERDVLVRKIAIMENDIKTKFAEIRLRKRNRIRTKVLRDDPHRKKFWKFIKNHTKSVGEITGMRDKRGEMVFDQSSIEEIVLQHFSSIFKAQRVPVFSHHEKNDHVASAIEDIDNILRRPEFMFKEDEFEKDICSPFTMTELSDILIVLPNEKASGVDGIPNELLKHSGETFRQYLLMFLNQIIASGEVPASLNTGKCILIHKVLMYICISQFLEFVFRVVILYCPSSIDPSQSRLTSCASLPLGWLLRCLTLLRLEECWVSINLGSVLREVPSTQ